MKPSSRIEFKALIGMSLLSWMIATAGTANADEFTVDYRIRDFSGSHSDFQQGILAVDPGIVADVLGADGKPIYEGGSANTTSGANSFFQWYHDVPAVNLAMDNSFVLDSTLTPDLAVLTFSSAQYFPIDNTLIGNEGAAHNYNFTSELHSSFLYRGGEQLTYTSDDDLWLFVNGVRVVDLGGIHTEQSQTLSLDDLSNTLGISKGNEYSFDLFFAEREPSGSSLRFDIPAPREAPSSLSVDVDINEFSFKDAVPVTTEVVIEVNPLNPKYLVTVGGSLHELFYSLDGGKSWTQLDMNIPVLSQTSNYWTDPSLAFDDNGTLYAINGIVNHDIAVCRFENGAFEAEPVPYTCTTFPSYDKWHVGAGPAPGNPNKQNVYVATVDDGIKVLYSTDDGHTFTKNPNRLGSGTFPRPVVASNGDVYVAWYDPSSNLIKIARSADGGQHFSGPVDVATSTVGVKNTRASLAQPERGIHAGPVIDVDRSGGLYDGSLYIVYVAQGATNNQYDKDIYLTRSQDQGQTWSEPIRVNDSGSATQFLPWVDVDQKTGTVSVLWYDTREDPDNVRVKAYLATSVDGGHSFGPGIAVSDAESDESSNNGAWTTSKYDYGEYIGVAVDGCVAHTVWSDNHMTHARADGWFRRNPIAGETLILNGVTWTFVNGTAGVDQTQIGATPRQTIKNLVHDLDASTDPRIRQAEYSIFPAPQDDILVIQAKQRGAAGGFFTLDTSVANGFINIKDTGRTIPRLMISLNQKTDQLPVPCAAGGQILAITSLAAPGAVGIQQYDARTGDSLGEFIASCVDSDPSQWDCNAIPGASENPVDLVYGPDKKLYVADRSIGRFGSNPTGIAIKRYFGNNGDYRFDLSAVDPFANPDPHAAFVRYGDGGLEDIGGLAFGPDSDLYASDQLTGTILHYDGQTGAFVATFVEAGTLQSPGKILFGPDGNLYVVETNGNRVLRFQGPFASDPGTSLGEFVSRTTGGLENTSSAVFGPDGQLYVSGGREPYASIRRYQGPHGLNPGAFVSETMLPRDISLSRGMAFGPDHLLYVGTFGSSAEEGILTLNPDSNQFVGALVNANNAGAFVFSSVPKRTTVAGDFDGDGCIDRVGDLTELMSAIRSGSSDEQFDLNSDGQVNILDARKLMSMFTKPRGAACP